MAPWARARVAGRRCSSRKTEKRKRINFMNKFLKTAPVLFAMALSLGAQPPTPPPTPKTTDVLVILTPKPGIDRAQMPNLRPQEARAMVRAYLDGKIRLWFSRSDGNGAMFIVPAADVAEAKALMDTLALGKVDYEYIALTPLTP